MPSNYYGTEGPTFILKDKEGVDVFTYTLDSPQEMDLFPSKMLIMEGLVG